MALAIETSCDETAVAVAMGHGEILASEVASQIGIHQQFGGIVPEVASRTHLAQLDPLIECALSNAGVALNEIDFFAATAGPGLATSLMLGMAAAKGLAVGARKPFLAVNHLEGHLLSPFAGLHGGARPSAGLIVSGGHTLLIDLAEAGIYRLLGQTRDDAAGEAFDKVARLLGLPYPGGPEIDRLARAGDCARFNFPRSMIASGDLGFSFSGLKTAVRRIIPNITEADIPDVCASFQEAVVDVLVAKTLAGARAANRQLVTVSGGVSCNTRLQARFAAACAESGHELLFAPPALSTDNAAMIACAALVRFRLGETTPLDSDMDPNLRLAA